MTLYKWSQIAAADATADGSINWQEGQAPSSINDSARAMMAAMAKYRDDVAGAIVSAGTSTAYTVSSFQVFDSLTRLNGQTIAFAPHATNGPTVTLNVDGLGAKPLRPAPGTELLAGTLVEGTPYTCTYSHADAAFYLRDFYVSPYSIPLGSCIDYWGSAAPSSVYALSYGQAISRSTYAALFSLFGTTYGSGDGSTTFNIPDLRGRIVAGKDDMGGSAASRLTSSYFGTSAATLGAVGGAESVTLSLAQLPTGITVNGTVTVNTASGKKVPALASGDTIGSVPTVSTGTLFAPYSNNGASWDSITSMSASNTLTSNNTSGNAHRTVQPTIIANKLLRIL